MIRGPRPKSEVWPRAKSGMPSQKDPQGGSKPAGGDAETGATFFDDTRRASGRSSCEGGQVGESSGRHWRGPMVWRWMQSRKALSKPKLPPTRSQCQSRSQIARFHRSGRETIGEVGRRARVGARSVGGGARTACASGGQRRSFRSFASVSPCCSDQLPNRLREDFVPNTVEEGALWMRCRQQDMEDAIAQGSEGDVSRLAHVIAEGPPSSVVNMVS